MRPYISSATQRSRDARWRGPARQDAEGRNAQLPKGQTPRMRGSPSTLIEGPPQFAFLVAAPPAGGRLAAAGSRRSVVRVWVSPCVGAWMACPSTAVHGCPHGCEAAVHTEAVPPPPKGLQTPSLSDCCSFRTCWTVVGLTFACCAVRLMLKPASSSSWIRSCFAVSRGRP